ncbi:MAG: sulfatase [Planctomycetaceae bacterium]|nr:sulfatase [Planctomycetaceae bacterium]
MKRFPALLFLISLTFLRCEGAAGLPHFLIITVDDMNCDSVGAFGCQLPDTTPNIDRFAATAMRFQHAHVQVGNCFPSRNVLLSGRYPHNTGVEGFYQIRQPQHPHLVDMLQQAGYFVAIRGKATHSTPFHPYHWDADLSVLEGKKQDIKNADSYYRSTKTGIALAQEAEKPFCLNVNISDPHKPFYAQGKQGATVPDSNVPSRVFTAEEVPIPGFLFDHPDVRKELAHYYSSVRRADDCFAAVMRALEESGEAERTIVVFLSDHGMPLPFAKTALWHHSTHTPWIMRWPGVTKAGSVDSEHMISAVDLMPTLLDIIGADHPDGFDGRSFETLLRGEDQDDRGSVYKVYNENSGGNRSPMRSVESKKFGYLFNPWSDGTRVFKTATTGTVTYRTMKKLAESDARMAARLEFFNRGVPEEFYDYGNDPDALHNLINDPRYAPQIAEHRARMLRYMEESGDHMLDVFRHREDAAARAAYVEQVQAEADARRKKKKAAQPPSAKKQYRNLFQLTIPEQAHRGQAFVVTVKHRLPAALGTQQFHVTLKDAAGKRIERVVESAKGRGQLAVSFALASELESASLRVSAFVGKDYATNLLHKTEGPVPLVD